MTILSSGINSPLARMKPTQNDIQNSLKKAMRGDILNFEDGVNLYACSDLALLGEIANERNLKLNGKDVFFNLNRHINPTNVCALSCQFCAFSRKPGDAGAYVYTEEQITEKASQAAESGATEIHMVGGLHPRWNIKNYTNTIALVKAAAPNVHIKAFTAVEIDWLSRREKKSTQEILQMLREAGLGSMPGGGAEIFHPEIREQICDTKLTAEGWLEIHRTAHKMGMRSNCTMLYGHIESVEHRVDHMMRLRELQAETNGFNVFIPLAYQPVNNTLAQKNGTVGKYTSGVDDLRTIAVARLMMHNFKHIKAYWVMTGDKLAQTALHFGANDLDGTVVEEKIANMAGSVSGMALSQSRLLRVIRNAGRIPVERNTLYEPIKRYENHISSTTFESENVKNLGVSAT